MDQGLHSPALERPIVFSDDQWDQPSNKSTRTFADCQRMLLNKSIPINQVLLTDRFYLLAPFLATLLSHAVDQGLLLRKVVGQVKPEEPVDERAPVHILEQILFLDQLEDKNHSPQKQLRILPFWTHEPFIDVDIEPQGNIEFLVIDPLFKGEDRTIVDFELRLGALQQLRNLVVELAETVDEGSVVLSTDLVESLFQNPHEPLNMSLDLLSLPESEELQNRQGKLFEEDSFIRLVDPRFVVADNCLVDGGEYSVNWFPSLFIELQFVDEGLFLLHDQSAPRDELGQISSLPLFCSCLAVVFTDQGDVVGNQVLLEELVLFVNFIDELQNCLKFSAGTFSSFECSPGQQPQGFRVTDECAKDVIVEALAQRHVHGLLAIVYIQEEAYFSHPLGYLLDFYQQGVQECKVLLFFGNKFPFEQGGQLFVEDVQYVCLSAKLGEFEDLVIGNLKGDQFRLVKDEIVHGALEGVQQSPSISLPLDLLILFPEVHLNLNKIILDCTSQNQLVISFVSGSYAAPALPAPTRISTFLPFCRLTRSLSPLAFRERLRCPSPFYSCWPFGSICWLPRSGSNCLCFPRLFSEPFWVPS